MQDKMYEVIIKLLIPTTMNKMSTVSHETIRNHLANNSTAKITHSFSRSKRFIQPNPECKQVSYGSTSSLSSRKAAIGYGIRSDFTKNSIVSPASPTYQSKSQFQKMGQTYSFRISRDKSPQRDYLYHLKKAKVPGPGTYQNQFKTRMTISYTHRPKTLDINKKKLSFLETPPPGHYESIPMTPHDGKSKLSKHRTVKLSVINKDIRFKPNNISSPGPLDYHNIDQFSKDSKYLLSHRKGDGRRPFDRQRKFTNHYWKNWQNSQMPGPAEYEKPSEFGIYGDVNYYRTLSIKD